MVSKAALHATAGPHILLTCGIDLSRDIVVVVVSSAKNPLTSEMFHTQAIIKDVEKKIDCFSPRVTITGILSFFSLFGSN